MAILERAGYGIALGAALLVAGCGGERPGEPPGPAAEGRRVVVEVLNGSGVRGLARRATRVLRGRGIDVVDYGNAAEPAESTVVILQRGERSAAERVVRVLGLGAIREGGDTLRRVDVTVVLGSDYRPLPDPRP